MNHSPSMRPDLMERQLASLMTGQWVVVLWVVLPDLWETVKDEQLNSLKVGQWVALMGMVYQYINEY